MYQVPFAHTSSRLLKKARQARGSVPRGLQVTESAMWDRRPRLSFAGEEAFFSSLPGLTGPIPQCDVPEAPVKRLPFLREFEVAKSSHLAPSAKQH